MVLSQSSHLIKQELKAFCWTCLSYELGWLDLGRQGCRKESPSAGQGLCNSPTHLYQGLNKYVKLRQDFYKMNNHEKINTQNLCSVENHLDYWFSPLSFTRKDFMESLKRDLNSLSLLFQSSKLNDGLWVKRSERISTSSTMEEHSGR